MTGAEIALILKLIDISIFLMERLPERNAEREAQVKRLNDMIRNGEQPTEADYARALEAIEAVSNERDRLIALKPKED